MSTLPVSSFDDELMVADLMGPFRFLVKFTLLDCSSKSKCPKFFAYLLSIFMIVFLGARVGLLMNTTGNPLSFYWGESNFFGFPALFAVVCALCLFGWTKNGFIRKFTKKLVKVRMLRVEPNSSIDSYRMVHVLAMIFSIPWLVAMMSWIIFNFTYGKIFYGGDESNIILRVLMLISNFYIWYISTVCLAHYVLVFSALNREANYFNQELKKAKEERLLKNIGVLEKFDFRQNELLEMILSANESLSSFGCFAPLFLFYGLVNGVYLTSFNDSVPLLYFVILLFNLAAIIFYNMCILFPACGLQEHLTTTRKILINNDEFEVSKDPIVYQTYRVMIDRLQKVDARIWVIAAFPITKNILAGALFVIPDLGFLLIIVKKVIIANGGHV